MDEARDITIAGARLTAQTQSKGGSWRADGVFANGVLDDPALAADITGINARWTAEPHGEDALVRILDGAARLTDRTPADTLADHRPAFNPLLLTTVSADLIEGRVVGRGNIMLEAGNRSLATFEAVHEVKTATGEAHVQARELAFSKRGFQPFEISERVRGMIDEVSGPLHADIDVDWSPGSLTAAGRVATVNMSLASATLPIVEGVTGEIVFSDLFTLSTGPGQQLSVGVLNPGVEVRDGVVQFQLLGDGRVALEAAQWPFAGGSLFVAPTIFTLGSRETRFNLLLRQVDVAALLEKLKVPDLTATGRVEGEFPLILTPTAALVENGVLRASPGGGTIAYTGRAGEEAGGLARLAFDALASFRYDSLSLELNGDLGGNVVAAVAFTGRNQDAINMTALTPGGSFPLMFGRGLPFRFNVRITAPFTTLSQTAAGIYDPGIHIERALDPVLTPQDVDPPAPSPR